MKKPITSSIQTRDSSYRKEHQVLLSMYTMYQNSDLVDQMSFSQYFDALMRLDSARCNHEIHNYFKTEHSLQENFSSSEWDDEGGDIL